MSLHARRVFGRILDRAGSGAVLETLRPERDLGAWSYTTAAMPDGEQVEIRFTYAPAVLSVGRLAAVPTQGHLGAGVDSGAVK